MMPRFLFIFLLFLLASLNAQLPENLTMYLKKFSMREGMHHAGFSLSVRETKHGEALLEWNPNLYLAPASVQKLLTTAAALDLLGPDFTFETKLWLLPGFSNQSAKLIVEPSGDPTLGSTWFSSTEPSRYVTHLIQWLKAKNIRSLDAILVDLSGFDQQGIPDSWIWADLGNYFGTPCSGLCFADNRTNLHFQTKQTGSKAKLLSVYPDVPHCSWSSEVIAGEPGSGDQAWIFGAQGQSQRLIRGEIPPNESDFVIRGSVPDPATFAVHNLSLGLRTYGVPVAEFEQAAPEANWKLQAQWLGSWKSPPLVEIVAATNTFSINLFAEQLLWALVSDEQKPKGFENGLNRLKTWIADSLGLKGGFYLADGSGLSRLNAISTGSLSQFLSLISRKPWFEKYYESLPVAGGRGTLSSFNSEGLKGHLHAKSGSMNRVRAYAGYLTAKSGKQLSVAAILNHFDCSSSQAQRELEALFQLIYESF